MQTKSLSSTAPANARASWGALPTEQRMGKKAGISTRRDCVVRAVALLYSRAAMVYYLLGRVREAG